MNFSQSELDPWLERELVCPRDKGGLRRDGRHLVCDASHRYPILEGIPIMLVDDAAQTLPDLTERSFAAAATDSIANSNGAAEQEIEPFVQDVIVGTNGNLYRRAKGRLARYPIPHIRLPGATAEKRKLLDLGCNWGRWTIAAARNGYHAVGIDPGVESIAPARRIARKLGVEARFVVGDARYVPFRDASFDVVYSYGVLQHFAPADAKLAVAEAARVATASGTVLVQMAARYGLLSLLQQARRGFRTARGFEVRYWKPSEIQAAFQSIVGPTALSVDGYLTLNPQPSDLDLLTFQGRQVVRFSEAMRALSCRLPLLLQFADSIFAQSVKSPR